MQISGILSHDREKTRLLCHRKPHFAVISLPSLQGGNSDTRRHAKMHLKKQTGEFSSFCSAQHVARASTCWLQARLPQALTPNAQLCPDLRPVPPGQPSQEPANTPTSQIQLLPSNPPGVAFALCTGPVNCPVRPTPHRLQAALPCCPTQAHCLSAVVFLCLANRYQNHDHKKTHSLKKAIEFH